MAEQDLAAAYVTGVELECLGAAGSPVLAIILVIAAVGGLAGVGYCYSQKKMCFAAKAEEGGYMEALV